MYSNFFYFVIKLILIGKLKIGEKLTFFCYKIFNLIDKEWKFVEEKYKILIVDDEQSILDMLKLQLLFILPAMRQRLWINYLTRRT